jgi:predicted Zn-dependent protease
VAGCQQVPVTGRSALSLVKHEDIVRLGVATFENRKRQHGILRDPEKNARVQRVGERIAQAVFWDVPDADWEFAVLNAPNTINASAAPGGKVLVYSGLFKIVHNDDQLAWVLAHEIAHVAARHTDERFSQVLAARTGSVAAIVGLGGLGAAQAGVQAYELTAMLATLSFDRKQELEADYMGMIYMARAGYDPEQAARAFENLADAKTAAGQPLPVELFSTHPSYPERILQLIDRLPRAQAEYQRAQKSAATALPVVR